MIKGKSGKTEKGHRKGMAFIRRAAMVLLLFFVCVGASLVQANAASKTFSDSDGGTISDPGTTYTIKGSAIITLKPEYLQKLRVKKHKMTVYFSDGSAKVSFTVKKGGSPDTGEKESLALWIALMALSAAELGVLALKRTGS